MMKSVQESQKVYAAKHLDERVRAESQSGGIFTALSDFILEESGIVYGCVLTEDFGAAHIRADSAELRDRMRGSKYIQSELGDTYKNVKCDLGNGRNVLFSGTLCQNTGLHNFLVRDYAGLICVDIICHGVTSKNVWMKYLAWQEKKVGKKVTSVDFRNKRSFGWWAHTETLTFDDGSKVNSQVFKTLFYGHMVLRPCCYECPYKSVLHPGDITIADYWGIEKVATEFDDNKGVSLVMVNTDKGEKILGMCKERLFIKKLPLKIVCNHH